MVSAMEGPERKLTHKAVNACLCPLYAVESCHVVTVEGAQQQRVGIAEVQNVHNAAGDWALACRVWKEPISTTARQLAGIGSGRAGLHPVQERLARAHGSQCGFCTPGMPVQEASAIQTHCSTARRQDRA